MKSVSVGSILTEIYNSEIPARIEWVWDGGFTWVLIDAANKERLPRVWCDDALQGRQLIASTPDAAVAMDGSQFLDVNWLARGKEKTIHAAVARLADAIVFHLPESAFAKSWQQKEQ